MHIVLGLDWGSRYIGLAIANTNDKIASILAIIPRKPWKDTSIQLQNICSSRHVSHIIMGWPTHHHSRRHGMIKSAIGLLKDTGLPPVILQNEGYTSCAADLINPNRKRNDDCAAAIILQDYLETL